MAYTDRELLSAISLNLQRGRAGQVGELARELLARGVPPVDIMNNGLIAGMEELGLRFRDNEVFVPEVLLASRAMVCGMNVLRPHIVNADLAPVGRVALGTVQGDIHDIGINMVRMFMQSKRIEVVYLGVDVAPARFVQAAKQHDCRVVCCSALLTTTMKVLGEVVRAFEMAKMRSDVKIMIGGAPVTEAYCRSIGADAYTRDATTAAETALRLIRETAPS